MFKYYIESIETENDNQEDNNYRSQTLLLASSRTHSNHHQNYQHSHMFSEDYQGLFYRKLNAIIHLQSLQQVLQQNETVLGQLSSTCLRQIVAKKDIKQLDCSQLKRDSECGVVLMGREMILLHGKVRRQCVLLRKKAQLEHEMTKLTIDKKSLIEEIKIFSYKLGEILLHNFNETSCTDLQKCLLQHARKYNLSKVITNFMEEIKSAIVSNQINQMINTLLKCSGEELKGSIKMEELKLFLNQGRNRKELINNLTLYLKEFYSTNVYKQFTDIINRLTKEYELAKFKNNYLSSKLSDQIQNNVQLLRRVLKQITVRSGQVMDYKIDIEILTEQIKLIQKNLWVAEQSMYEYINKETQLLLTEYHIHEGKLFRLDITNEKLNQMADYKYFNQQLTNKYKLFLVEHLHRAEEIEKTKEKIQQYNLTLTSYEKQLKMLVSPSHSRLFSYRKTNERKELMSKVSCEDEFYEQQIQEQNQQQLTQTQQHNYTQQKYHKSKHNTDSIAYLQQEQLPLKQIDYNTFSPKPQTKKKQNQSCSDMALKMTALLNQCQRKQKFLVNKVVSIGSNIQSYNQLKKYKPNNGKQYQAKLTKKYLILQPINQQILSICEKIDWNQIKNYTPNYHTATLVLQYGGCRLLLNFVTFNMDIFVKRMEKVHRPVNKS